ncbi:MAG: MMPL family transporter [Sporolactobacillus sp.]
MGKIINLRWILLVVWIIGLAALILTAPNMNELAREKGGYSMPKNYSTSVAAQIKKQLSSTESGNSYIAVFHASHRLTTDNMQAIKKTIQRLKDHKKSLHITGITDSFENQQLKSQLLSKNHQSLIVTLQVNSPRNPSVIHEYRQKIDERLTTSGVKAYLTGEQLINDDMSTSAEAGLERTEWITVVFILVVLLLVFRSIVAPFIPLVCVGLSYIAAQSVVAFLVKYFNFPISNFTQIFMVAIMFGIGTDYCILLLSRFKEELAHGKSNREATIDTFKTAGQTVLHSGLPVFVAFLALAFTRFSLYRSAVAVGVGIIFLLLALFTILPLFTVSLGRHMFWPMSHKISQPKSDIWAWAGNLAFGKPIIALLIVALFIVPPILSYRGILSFNSPEELGNQYPAKTGFNVLSNDFGSGNISPVTIYLKNDLPMRNAAYVARIEQLSTKIASNSDVKQVMSISRPLGHRLNDIYVSKQSSTMHQGLSSADDGLGKLKNSLSTTGKRINNSQPQLKSASDSIGKLQSGTKKTNDGIASMTQALGKISSGIQSGQTGVGEIQKNISSAQTQLNQLQSGQIQLQSGYQKVADNLHTLSNQLNQFSSSSGQPAFDTSQLTEEMGQIQNNLQAYITAHPEAMADPNFQQLAGNFRRLAQTMTGMQTQLSTESSSLKQQLNNLNQAVQALSSAMDQLNRQSAKITDGIGQFKSGLTELNNGLGQLKNGLAKAHTAQNQVVAHSPEITGALNQIADGQGRLKSGFAQVQSQMGSLSSGLAKGSDGAGKIQNGIHSANTVIGNWSDLPYNQSGIYVPSQLFSNKGFKQAMNTYMSKNGKVTSIRVTMKNDPYSTRGMAQFQALKKEIPHYIKGTAFENAKIGIDGIASSNSDLKRLANADYHRAVTLVLIGVFIALVIVLRSLTMPIYLMASLLMTYFSSLGFAELLFTRLFHFTGLTWTTQFFGFIVLIALGIDYSIFVMTRFNEYAAHAIKERMILTLWHMGSVILSAVVILGGTFAAMIPSGMLSLVEIATVVIIGLILYAVLIIPLFVPVMVRLFGKGNWWPFISKKHVIEPDSGHSANHNF